jgi:hypothetical protein
LHSTICKNIHACNIERRLITDWVCTHCNGQDSTSVDEDTTYSVWCKLSLQCIVCNCLSLGKSPIQDMEFAMKYLGLKPKPLHTLEEVWRCSALINPNGFSGLQVWNTIRLLCTLASWRKRLLWLHTGGVHQAQEPVLQAIMEKLGYSLLWDETGVCESKCPVMIHSSIQMLYVTV